MADDLTSEEMRALGAYRVGKRSDPGLDQNRGDPFLEQNKPPLERFDPKAPQKDMDEIIPDLREMIIDELLEIERTGKDRDGKFRKRLDEIYREWRAMPEQEYNELVKRFERVVPPVKSWPEGYKGF